MADFKQGVVENADGVDTSSTELQNAKPQDEKKYTDADLDRIIAQKLGRQRAKYEREQAEQDRITAIDDREKALCIRERKADARDELQSKGLPRSLCELIDYSSDETYKASMAAAADLVQEIEEAIEKRRATGCTPKSYKSYSDPDACVRSAFNL